MSATVGAMLISVAANLATPLFEKFVAPISDPIKAAFVKSKLETTCNTAFLDLESYLKNEVQGPDQDEKIKRIILEVKAKIETMYATPADAIVNGLDAKRFVDSDIRTNGYPTTVLEDGTTNPFAHLYQLCARIVFELPNLMSEWKKDLWSANFVKLDGLGQLLLAQTQSVNEISKDMAVFKKGKISADQAMINLKGALRQANARSMVEMHGLSRVQATPLQLKSIFVAPKITGEDSKLSLDTEDEIIKELTYVGKTFRIMGPAGSGKTTLSKWLEEWFWRSSQRLALRCELRTISQKQHLPSMLELLDSIIPKEMLGTSTSDDFSRWINEGLILIIFDGFDEVPPERRTVISDWISNLKNSVNSDNSYIITSRDLTTKQLDDEFWKDTARLRVLGFDRDRVLSYIDKWQRSMLQPEELDTLRIEEKPEALTEVFMSAPTIKELTSNPLLLSTLMMVHRFEEKKLPDGRSDLYRVYIDGMLGQWYNKTGDAHEIVLKAHEMKRLLRTLASHMQVHDIASVDEETAVAWLEEENTTDHDTLAVLEHMLERTGLLIGPGQYQFAHKSIGEFLVAQAVIAEQVRVDDILLDRLFLLGKADQDQWRVVLFLWAGLVESTLDLLDFSAKLIDLGQEKAGLGILLDRVGLILKDHPDKLEKTLISALSVNRNIENLDEASAYYCGLVCLWKAFPGSYKLPSQGYLTISGVEHFTTKIFRHCVHAGILKPTEDLFQKLGANSYVFELWTSWIEEGVSYSKLQKFAPTWLNEDQKLTTIIQYRRTYLRIDDYLNAELNALFQPWILDRLIGTILQRYRVGTIVFEEVEEEEEQEAELSLARKFVQEFPINTWPKDVFLLEYREVYSRFDPHNEKIDWDDSTGFPPFDKLEAKLKPLFEDVFKQGVSLTKDFLLTRSRLCRENGLAWPLEEKRRAKEKRNPLTISEVWGVNARKTVVKYVEEEINTNGRALHLLR